MITRRVPQIALPVASRVGMIGFSAGRFGAAEVAVRYAPEGPPAFVVVIYGGLMKDAPVPTDAPPMFIAAATDDELGLAPQSMALYQKWTAAHKSAELHLYAKGNHGFGMHEQHIPTAHWGGCRSGVSDTFVGVLWTLEYMLLLAE